LGKLCACGARVAGFTASRDQVQRPGAMGRRLGLVGRCGSRTLLELCDEAAKCAPLRARCQPAGIEANGDCRGMILTGDKRLTRRLWQLQGWLQHAIRRRQNHDEKRTAQQRHAADRRCRPLMPNVRMTRASDDQDHGKDMIRLVAVCRRVSNREGLCELAGAEDARPGVWLAPPPVAHEKESRAGRCACWPAWSPTANMVEA
jgi:hypothetical protein